MSRSLNEVEGPTKTMERAFDNNTNLGCAKGAVRTMFRSRAGLMKALVVITIGYSSVVFILISTVMPESRHYLMMGRHPSENNIHQLLASSKLDGFISSPKKNTGVKKKTQAKWKWNQEEGSVEVKDRYNSFPISIYNEKFESWEEILHPSSEVLSKLRPNDSKLQYMRVPKFWDPLDDHKNDTRVDSSGIREYLGQYGDRLMTKQEALAVGTYITNGDDEDLGTIFVMVASFRDFQCPQTIESMFSRAKYPTRIRIGIIDQTMANDDEHCSKFCTKADTKAACQYRAHIDTFTMDANEAVGPVFARHIGSRMYRGEYFVLQVDAHVDFIQDWDTLIINQWKSAKNEMAVLTAYMSDVTGSIDPVTHKSNHPGRPIMCQTDYEGLSRSKHLRHGQQPEGVPLVGDQPMVEPFWAAGFSFARGHFLINVPYDQHLPNMFQGEEINIAVRGFTYGYDFYTPTHQVCFHYYAVSAAGQKKERQKVPLFWSVSNQYSNILGIKSTQRSNQIIELRLKGKKTREEKEKEFVDYKKYGIGNARSVDLFYDLYGIDRASETVAKGLCLFAGKNMHYVYLQHLRDNRMGIDYTNMTYRFKDVDLAPNSWSTHVPPMDLPTFKYRLGEILASKGNE